MEFLNFIGCIVISVLIVRLIVNIIASREPYLNFHGHFRPKRHFFFERCSKCGKRLKHYHWFWGKGDFMACDVDYDGNTEWLCKECDDEISKNAIHKVPHL